MESSKFGYWLQIGANLGILAGLILVGLQLQQNSRLMELQIINDQNEAYNAGLWAAAGEQYADVWEKHLEEPENLSLSEMRVLEAGLLAPLSRWATKYTLFEMGLLDSSVWKDAVRTDATFLFASDYDWAYWQVIRTGDTYPQELVNYIDARLAEAPDRTPASFYQRVQAALAKKRDQ